MLRRYGRVCSVIIAAFLVNLLLWSLSGVFDLNELFTLKLNGASGDVPRNPAVVSSGDGCSNDNTTAKEKIMLKYFRDYRYVLPAPRYNYNPYLAPDCGTAPNFDKFFALNEKQRSRLGEDKFIYQTFFNTVHGSNDTAGTNGPPRGSAGKFVEIGAFDGLGASNSHFFEKCLGWDGLLVEGNPINYQKVVSNRPFVHKMSFAPSCKEDSTVHFSRSQWANAGIKGYAKAYDKRPTIDVLCGPFTPVLEDVFHGRRINFFSLDVEGAEMLVLSTIDFSKISVDVWMIEIQNEHCREDCAVRRQVREKMKQEGYKRYERLVHASDIYVDPNSPYQIPEAIERLARLIMH